MGLDRYWLYCISFICSFYSLFFINYTFSTGGLIIITLTRKELKKLIKYKPRTGKITWKVNRSGIKIGDEAGYICNSTKYRKIQINKKLYYAHRLAWLYMKGYFPDCQIDHKDRNRTNNKWTSLSMPGIHDTWWIELK